MIRRAFGWRGKKKYCRKRDSTEREGSSQLTYDAKVDLHECNYHRRLALVLIKGAENLGLVAPLLLLLLPGCRRKRNDRSIQTKTAAERRDVLLLLP